MRIPVAVPVMVLVLAAAMAGCSSSSSGGATAGSTSSPTTTPTPSPSVDAALLPTIPESFTELSCPKNKPAQTTLQLEGCAEHRIVALDRQITAAAAALFGELPTPAARRRLILAQVTWIADRHAACTRAANAYAGGSLAPVAFANCEVRMDRARLAQLSAMRGESSP